MGMICAASSTRCFTSRTLVANGASYLMSSVPGPGSGPNFAGGQETIRGLGFSPRCTQRREPLSVARRRCPRWSSSALTWLEALRTEASPSTTGAIPMVGPSAPSKLCAWTSRACRSVRAWSPRQRPKPEQSSCYSRTLQGGALTNGSDSCSWTGAPPSPRLSDCRQGSTTNSGESDGTSRRAMNTGPRSFALSSRLAGRGGPWPPRTTSTILQI